MNRRVIKKKFYQEVIYDVHGVRNSKLRIVLRFSSLCLKVFGGALLTLVLAPLSLIRPIEIWQMNTRLSKISFFIEDLETGLRDLQSRNQAGQIWLIALYPVAFPNKQLAVMYRRHLWILGKKQRWLAESARFVWPIFGVVKKRVKDRSPNKFKLWNAGIPTLSFTDSENKRGISLSREMDLPGETPYVCFAISSSKYRELVDIKQSEGSMEKNNLITIIPELSSYFPLINDLTSKKISVVRMGVHEDFRLPESLGDLIKDYAFGNQSEFGDIWLSSNCKYFVSAGVGAWWLGAIFGKRTVITDSYALRGSSGSSDLFIPQLAWLIRENCYATFEWMVDNYMWALDSDRLGIEYTIVRNTSQQIVDVNNEMLKRLDGTWRDEEEDLELQERLRSLQMTLNTGERAPARMGAKFLREHQHLLPQ
jgi:putative glycosyltransferase (TIGR04372 family)